VSISPTFYDQLFGLVFFAAFLYLQFGFVIFWQNNIGIKADRKMLLKLTKGGSIPHFSELFQSKNYYGISMISKLLQKI